MDKTPVPGCYYFSNGMKQLYLGDAITLPHYPDTLLFILYRKGAFTLEEYNGIGLNEHSFGYFDMKIVSYLHEEMSIDSNSINCTESILEDVTHLGNVMTDDITRKIDKETYTWGTVEKVQRIVETIMKKSFSRQ